MELAISGGRHGVKCCYVACAPVRASHRAGMRPRARGWLRRCVGPALPLLAGRIPRKGDWWRTYVRRKVPVMTELVVPDSVGLVEPRCTHCRTDGATKHWGEEGQRSPWPSALPDVRRSADVVTSLWGRCSQAGRRLCKAGRLMYLHIVKQHPNRVLASFGFVENECWRRARRLRLGTQHGFMAEMTAGQ